MIHWGEPSILLALGAVPPVAWLLVRAHRRRASDAARFADAEMLARLMPAPSSWRPAVKTVAMLLGLACVVVAGARPRFGVSFEEAVQRGADLVALLDVSRSMMAEDVAPNRLRAAKAGILSLLDQSGGDRVGLIVFAGKPVLKAPLTADRAFLREILEEIDVESAPRGGTRLGDAIVKALETLAPRGDRDQAIVLFTDGEDHDSRPEAAARQAAERNVKVFTVALGDTRTGARVPRTDASGRRTFLLYEGQEVWSKANEGLLRVIAAQTGGVFVPAGSGGYHLGPTWKELLGSLNRGEIREQKRITYAEQFQWFLGAGILFLLADVVVPRYPTRRSRTRREDRR